MTQVNRQYPFRLFFLVLLCAYFFSLPAFSQTPVTPVAKKGIIDLRQADLQKQNISLSGEWAIYWKQLLTPQKDSATTPNSFVPFPVLWKNTIINGQPLPSIGYASYSLTVYLPKHSKKLALQIPDTYASYRLFINDEEFAKAGNPDSVKESSEPKWIPYTIELDTKSDTLRLILQVANFWHSKGGPYKNIILGDRDNLFNEKEKDAALDLVLTGCLFMGGLFFFGLFLFGKHDKSILYFALFCMVYSYRIIGARSYVLHSVFPDIPWVITVHLEYLTLFISVAFFSLYTHYLYPEDSNRYATRIQDMVLLRPLFCCNYISTSYIHQADQSIPGADVCGAGVHIFCLHESHAP